MPVQVASYSLLIGQVACCTSTPTCRAPSHAGQVPYATCKYVGLLEVLGVALSITQHGDPYENAVAERVNGILKEEFDVGKTLPGFAQATELVHQATRACDELRTYSSCDFLTPGQAHSRKGR